MEVFPDAVAISALKGEGMNDLLEAVQIHLYEIYTFLEVHLPYSEGKLISLFHEQGQVELVEHMNGGVLIRGRIPGRILARFESYLREQDEE
jgi:GTP-binding protein HflX